MWKALRDFTFPARLVSTIASSDIEDNLPPTTVGAVRYNPLPFKNTLEKDKNDC